MWHDSQQQQVPGAGEWAPVPIRRASASASAMSALVRAGPLGGMASVPAVPARCTAQKGGRGSGQGAAVGGAAFAGSAQGGNGSGSGALLHAASAPCGRQRLADDSSLGGWRATLVKAAPPRVPHPAVGARAVPARHRGVHTCTKPRCKRHAQRRWSEAVGTLRCVGCRSWRFRIKTASRAN